MLEPHVPEELTSYIVEAYVALRAQSGAEADNGDQVTNGRRFIVLILHESARDTGVLRCGKPTRGAGCLFVLRDNPPIHGDGYQVYRAHPQREIDAQGRWIQVMYAC